MTISSQKKHRDLSSRRCKFISSALKDAFFNCRYCDRSLSFFGPEEVIPHSYLNDELQVVSIIKARAMEAKLRRKNTNWNDSFSSVFYPVTLSELFVRTTASEQCRRKSDHPNKIQKDEGKEENKEEYLSVGSHFSCSCCSSAAEFVSVRTSFSDQCPSLKEVEMFPELKRRSVIQELSHCQGWPFGLCRRALLLPPLPKSPSNSWSWCKSMKIIKEG